MTTKAELREQITVAGLEQPPSSATKAELVAALAAAGTHTDDPSPIEPQHPPARSSFNTSVTLCAGGRPLLTDVCRRCYVAGVTDCPGA